MKVIETKEMAIKFRQGKYDVELENWIRKNCYIDIERQIFRESGHHVIECLKSIVSGLFGLCPCGSFGKAVLDNDFLKVTTNADSTNLFMLRIYMLFLNNLLPYQKLKDYRK